MSDVSGEMVIEDTTRGVDIIVVDDDPAIGEMSRELLSQAGYNVLLIDQSDELLPALGQHRPKAILLDVMMPGTDGMTLLREIKGNSAFTGIKVALVTSKSFALEKQRAYEWGADLFLSKPYNITTFASTIAELIARPAGQPAQPASFSDTARVTAPAPRPAPPPDAKLMVRLWGCRGFTPYLANSVSRYGRQTPCVSIETPYGVFILDAGSGIIPLGLSLVKGMSWSKELWVLLSHFHIDHIMGLGAFPCAHDPQYKIHLASANDGEKDINELLAQTFSGALTSFYPPPKAQLVGYTLLEGSYQMTPEVELHVSYMRHPSTTLGFRLEVMGKSIVYIPDNELHVPESDPVGAFPTLDDKLINFCQSADLLIHDSRYTDEDYARHRNMGHSGLSSVLELAASKCNVKQLVLFHLDPGYSDETLDTMQAKAQQLILQRGWPLRCRIASENLAIEV